MRASRRPQDVLLAVLGIKPASDPQPELGVFGTEKVPRRMDADDVRAGVQLVHALDGLLFGLSNAIFQQPVVVQQRNLPHHHVFKSLEEGRVLHRRLHQGVVDDLRKLRGRVPIGAAGRVAGTADGSGEVVLDLGCHSQSEAAVAALGQNRLAALD